MRLASIALVLVIAHGAARADAFHLEPPPLQRDLAGKRVRTGAGLLGAGLGLVLAGALSGLSSLQDGREVAGIITGPVIGGTGLILTAIGAPILGVGLADRDGPPTRATLQRRRAAGYALVGIGVAMQLASIVVTPFFTGRLFEYSSSHPTHWNVVGPMIGVGCAGVAVMASGIPLVSMAKRDIKVSAGLGGLAMTF